MLSGISQRTSVFHFLAETDRWNSDWITLAEVVKYRLEHKKILRFSTSCSYMSEITQCMHVSTTEKSHAISQTQSSETYLSHLLSQLQQSKAMLEILFLLLYSMNYYTVSRFSPLLVTLTFSGHYNVFMFGNFKIIIKIYCDKLSIN